MFGFPRIFETIPRCHFHGLGGGGSLKGIPFASASCRRLSQSACQARYTSARPCSMPCFDALFNTLFDAIRDGSLYFMCEAQHNFAS